MPYGVTPVTERSYYDAYQKGSQDRQQEAANALNLKRGEQAYSQNALAQQYETQDRESANKKAFATEMVQAAQYGLQSPNAKDFIRQNYPQLAKLNPTFETDSEEAIKASLQQAIGVFGPQAGIGPAQPKTPEAFTLSPGQTRYGPDGKPVASVAPSPGDGANVNQQLITRPVGNGLVQDFAWNPRTNRRVPTGEPYKPVTPHTGNVTEGERKAAALGTRLEAALQEIGAVELQTPGSSRPGVIERGLDGMGLEMAANVVRSDDRQRADTAQLDALDAALTLATGAAYTREQLQNLRKSYFPQIGDSDAAVKAKAKRFETIVKTARIAAGRAEPSIDKAVGGGQTPSEPTATDAKGNKVVYRNGQWQPL